MRFSEGPEGVFFCPESPAVLPLIAGKVRQAVRIGRVADLVTRISMEIRGVEVGGQRVVVFAQIQVGLPKVVEGRGSITRYIHFLTEPESLLKISTRVLVLALGKVDVPDVVERQTFRTFVPCFVLCLEGFLRRL